jgi:hypothetical protein
MMPTIGEIRESNRILHHLMKNNSISHISNITSEEMLTVYLLSCSHPKRSLRHCVVYQPAS